MGLGRPSIECDQVDSGEAVDAINGSRYKDGNPKNKIGKLGKTRLRLEILKILREARQ